MPHPGNVITGDERPFADAVEPGMNTDEKESGEMESRAVSVEHIDAP